jgi:manganese/zinc/iron transport system permease protein
MVIDAGLQPVLIGTTLLGAVTGSLGTFAVVRRQSLLGDALSHAALPGVALGFFLFGRETPFLLLGAGGAGWLALWAVMIITRRGRVSFDATLAGILSVTFGAGLVGLRKAQTQPQGAGLELYLVGQAGTLSYSDVSAVIAVGLLALIGIGLTWNLCFSVSFDPTFAQTIGYRVKVGEAILVSALVLAVVVGLQAVGAALLSALLVAPAIAARPWVNRLIPLIILASLFGSVSCALGAILSHYLSDPTQRLSIPTGPTIVLCLSALTILSFLIHWLRKQIWLRQGGGT